MGLAVYRHWPWRLRAPVGRKILGLPGLLLAVVGLSLVPDIDAAVGIVLNDIGRYHNNFVGAPLFGVVVAF